MSVTINAGDFTPEQKRYLEGFVAGVQASDAARPAATKTVGPDAIHVEAQDRVIARGGALNDQEKIKREQHPFDAYARLVAQAKRDEAPKPADNFRWRYHGLFYVAPT
ncbi:MAG TPA: NirA family protein, partial [Methylocystis sp.]